MRMSIDTHYKEPVFDCDKAYGYLGVKIPQHTSSYNSIYTVRTCPSFTKVETALSCSSCFLAMGWYSLCATLYSLTAFLRVSLVSLNCVRPC